ncbi:nose resistant to fluoxetine protein 6-like [Saccostrea cucullata]|uniref:nose resistant to fluoxetine protein 6-like n=1 Tax=Saccostrea cuccullata TaxID=36930 RepID=UPI002ED2F908
MILGTLYDFVNIQYPIYKSGKMDEKSVNKSMDSDGIYKLKSFDENPTNVDTDKKDDKNKDGVFGKILLSFSIYTNAKKILNTSQPKGSLTAVNGIRFLSMSWVILGHTWAFTATSQFGCKSNKL